MNLSKSLLLASMSLFLITSCSKDEDQLKAPQSENIPELGDVKSDVTYGPIIQSVHNVEESETLTNKNSTFYSPWAKITTNDLRELSKGNIRYTDLDFLKNRFTAVVNQGSRRPQSISINGYRNGKGNNPTGKYNWYAYMRTVGKKTKTKNSKRTKWQTASSIISYRNNTKRNKWMSYKAEIRVTDTKTTGWSIGGSVSLEVGGEVKVPLLAGASTKLTVSMNGERNGSNTTSVTEVIRGDVGKWVKPGHLIKFAVIKSHINTTTTWSIPLAFKGSVAADYGRKKHNGNHFKATAASRFFYEYQGQQLKRTLNVSEQRRKEYRIVAWTAK